MKIKEISRNKQRLLSEASKKLLIFLKILTIFSMLPIIIAVYFGLFPLFSLALIFIIPYTFYYLKKSIKKDNFYLVNYILADLEFVLWPIILLIAKKTL